jgi:hypothetical protein
MPWLVRDVVYESARQTAPAIVTIHLAANRGTVEKSDRGTGSKSVSFTADDVVKKTIPELLLASGLFHETAELKAVYEKDVEDFAAYRVKTGEQFLGSGFGMNIKGYRNQTVELVNARLVNDEEVITRKITEGASNEFWEDYGLVDYFKSMPLHCRLYMFHLGLHENFWVHVNALKPYVYRPELREKLILPELHRDLIDILTQDMNVIMDDIVEGKSGGTTILCNLVRR